MNYQLGNVVEPGKPVKFHVRIEHPAGRLIHYFLFEQCVADAHGERAITTAFGGLEVDDQTAILHRHHFLYFYDAGFHIDFNVRHPYSANTAISKDGVILAGNLIIMSACSHWHCTDLRTSQFPVERPARIALHPHLTIHAFEIVRLRVESGGDFGEERFARIHGGAPSGGAHSARSSRTTGTTRRSIKRIANVKIDSFDRNPKRFGCDDDDRRSSSGADILRAHLYIDRAIGMDGQIAIADMAASTPSVNREPEPASHASRNILAARTPLLFPPHQVRSDCQFVAIDIATRSGNFKVLQPEIKRIHVELGCEIIQ